MRDQDRRATKGEVVSWFVSEEAVYLKVAVSDDHDRHLGWAKGVRITRDTLEAYLRSIDRRLNEALQMELPWEGEVEPDHPRWRPPQP